MKNKDTEVVEKTRSIQEFQVVLDSIATVSGGDSGNNDDLPMKFQSDIDLALLNYEQIVVKKFKKTRDKKKFMNTLVMLEFRCSKLREIHHRMIDEISDEIGDAEYILLYNLAQKIEEFKMN